MSIKKKRKKIEFSPQNLLLGSMGLLTLPQVL